MILDTSFLIHLFREQTDAFEKGVEFSERGIIQRVPAPVVAELSYGVAMYGTTDEKRAFQNAMRMYPVVDVTRERSRRAGVLLAQADETSGGDSGADTVDAMVAAVADVLGEPVVTDNVKRFEVLTVDVESY